MCSWSFYKRKTSWHLIGLLARLDPPTLYYKHGLTRNTNGRIFSNTYFKGMFLLWNYGPNVSTCVWLDVDCRKVLPDGLIEKVNDISKSRNVVEILIPRARISDLISPLCHPGEVARPLGDERCLKLISLTTEVRDSSYN